MIRILEIDRELEELKECKATERNSKVIGRRLDLEAERRRLMFAARQQANLLKAGHRPRF